MRLVYYVSETSRSSRPSARHIDNGKGEPLCGGNGRKPLLWAQEDGEPTCKVCLDPAIMEYGTVDDADKSGSSTAIIKE
jgi:hypothetical protein